MKHNKINNSVIVQGHCVYSAGELKNTAKPKPWQTHCWSGIVFVLIFLSDYTVIDSPVLFQSSVYIWKIASVAAQPLMWLLMFSPRTSHELSNRGPVIGPEEHLSEWSCWLAQNWAVQRALLSAKKLLLVCPMQVESTSKTNSSGVLVLVQH